MLLLKIHRNGAMPVNNQPKPHPEGVRVVTLRKGKKPRKGWKKRMKKSSAALLGGLVIAGGVVAIKVSGKGGSGLTTADRATSEEAIRIAYGLGDSQINDILDLADEMGVSGVALANLIYFESKFDTKARHPSSNATGIIQFMPSTAEGLGTTVDALYNMSWSEQWEYVKRYFAPYKGSVSSDVDLDLVIFYPAYIGKSPDTRFPDNVVAANTYGDTVIATPNDYHSLVTKHSLIS